VSLSVEHGTIRAVYSSRLLRCSLYSSLIQSHGKVKPNTNAEMMTQGVPNAKRTPTISGHRPNLSMTHAELGAAAMSSSPQFPKMPVPASEAIMGISALDEKLRRGAQHAHPAHQADGWKAG
jgi:hypothetical protein